MGIPISITARGMNTSETLKDIAHEKIERMSSLLGSGSSCRITLSQPHKHKTSGNEFSIRIQINDRGRSLLVSKVGNDAYMLLRNAFDILFLKFSNLYGKARSRRENRRSKRNETPGLLAVAG